MALTLDDFLDASLQHLVESVGGLVDHHVYGTVSLGLASQGSPKQVAGHPFETIEIPTVYSHVFSPRFHGRLYIHDSHRWTYQNISCGKLADTNGVYFGFPLTQQEVVLLEQ